MNLQERTQAIGHIYYESQMLSRSYSRYWQPVFRANDDWLHNSILEATLIHVRALTEFFEISRTPPPGKRPPFADDILAEDYGFPVTKLNFPPVIRDQINKRIAHLSYERNRIDPTEKHWDFSSFVPAIIARSREFITHLRDIKHPFPDWPTPQMIAEFLKETAAKVA